MKRPGVILYQQDASVSAGAAVDVVACKQRPLLVIPLIKQNKI